MTAPRRAMQRINVRLMWAFVLLAACATAAQGQLDSTLGDVLGAIASVIKTLSTDLQNTAEGITATSMPCFVRLQPGISSELHQLIPLLGLATVPVAAFLIGVSVMRSLREGLRSAFVVNVFSSAASRLATPRQEAVTFEIMAFCWSATAFQGTVCICCVHKLDHLQLQELLQKVKCQRVQLQSCQKAAFQQPDKHDSPVMHICVRRLTFVPDRAYRL